MPQPPVNNTMFRFGQTDNVVFGQTAPNAAPRPAPAAMRPRLRQRAPAAPVPFQFNVNLTQEQAAQLMPTVPRQQSQPTPSATPTATPQTISPVRPAQPSAPLFPNLNPGHSANLPPRGISDLGLGANQTGLSTSQLFPRALPAPLADTNMRALSNLGDYSTTPRLFPPRSSALSTPAFPAPPPLTISAQPPVATVSSSTLPGGSSLTSFPVLTVIPAPAMPNINFLAGPKPATLTPMPLAKKTPQVATTLSIPGTSRPKGTCILFLY